MKSQKIITIISIILLIVIITLASFLGIYKREDYKVSNVVPDYILGMEFTNSRVLNFRVNDSIKSTTIYDSEGNEITEKEEGVEYTEENGYKVVENKANPDDVLTKENYKKSKSILQNRLNKLGVEQYNIKQDENSGNIQIEMIEGNSTDDAMGVLAQRGKFEILDAETKEVLLDNNSVKTAKLAYGQTSSGVSVYLQIKFNKEGQAKLEEISNTYVETKQEVTDENGETKEETSTKNVEVAFDGETYRTTYFGETIKDGNLSVMIGSATNSADLQTHVLTATQMAAVLNTEVLPIDYSISSYQASPLVSDKTINVLICVAVIAVVIMIAYLIIKFRLNGIFAGVLQIGYIALLLLTLRYTNIKITIEGMVGIVISVVLNYMYIYTAFKNLEDRFIKDTTFKFILKLIPIYIIAIIFTFNKFASIASLGMTLFWGIVIMYLYNIILTQITVKTVRK